MKERPLPFTAHEVRALLAGTKTQKRRVVRNPHRNDGGFVICDYGDGWWPYRSHDNESGFYVDRRKDGDYYSEAPLRCPHGYVGDRIWVRETWAYGIHALASKRDEDGPFVYAADGQGTQGRLCDQWRPSIHMPRWASRILLEITSVRVERLRDISEKDAIAEGCFALPGLLYPPEITDKANLWTGKTWTSAVAWYRDLWESINGRGSWDANPWVWVLEFKRVEGGAQ